MVLFTSVFAGTSGLVKVAERPDGVFRAENALDHKKMISLTRL
jgi:hypothetical protein